MVEAGEWPEPELMEQIVRAGDASVEPLIAILHSRPRGWPAEASLEHAIGLLSMLRPPDRDPRADRGLKCYKNEPAQAAAYALVDFGDPGFDALIELCRDPSLDGYRRSLSLRALLTRRVTIRTGGLDSPKFSVRFLRT